MPAAHATSWEVAPCNIPPWGQGRGGTLPRTTMQEGAPCHIPPWGHGRGGSMLSPTTGPWARWHLTTSHPEATHHIPPWAAWDCFGTGVLALPYVATGAAVGAAGTSPPHRCDMGRCQQHLQEGKSSWGTKGSHLLCPFIPAPQTREEGRGANCGTHGDAASPDTWHGPGLLADVPLHQVL